MFYESPLNGILLQSIWKWTFWIFSMKKQINCIMRASNLSPSALYGSREGREGQACWTHHTRAGWRPFSIKLDFGARRQGRNNYTVPMVPEVLLAGDRWGVGGTEPTSPLIPLTLSGDGQCLCGSHHRRGAAVHKGNHTSRSVLRC